MAVPRNTNNGLFHNFIREIESQYERYSYFDYDDDGYRPARSFPARPGQLRHEQLLQIAPGSILRIHYGNESKLWRLTGFAAHKFLVERIVDGHLQRQELFYTDHCLLPYDTGTWNSANWVAVEVPVIPPNRPIRPSRREIILKLDWRRFGF